jgi:hypothetical protein
MIAEFVASKPEHIEWQDSETGKMREAEMLRHNVVSGDEVFAVNERTKADFVATKYVSPFKRGQKVVIVITSLSRIKGMTKYGGELHAFVDDDTPATGKTVKA